MEKNNRRKLKEVKDLLEAVKTEKFTHLNDGQVLDMIYDIIKDETEPERETKVCSHCESEDVYLFAVVNGIDVYDCKDCHKRSTY